MPTSGMRKQTTTAIRDRIKQRPVAPDDRDFLLDVYEASRETELSMTPWDAAQKRTFATHQFGAQTAHYLETYPDAAHDIILYNNEPAGRLYVDRGKERIEILDVTILPEHHKNGIATAIVKELQSEAAATDRSLAIYVEKFNPSQKLFGDLGFIVTEDDGINLRFEWRDPPGKK